MSRSKRRKVGSLEGGEGKEVPAWWFVCRALWMRGSRWYQVWGPSRVGLGFCEGTENVESQDSHSRLVLLHLLCFRVEDDLVIPGCTVWLETIPGSSFPKHFSPFFLLLNQKENCHKLEIGLWELGKWPENSTTPLHDL